MDRFKKFNNIIQENNSEKRYVATIEFYVYAKDDNEAIEYVNKFCDEQKTKEDNQCEITNLIEQPFGTIESRKII